MEERDQKEMKQQGSKRRIRIQEKDKDPKRSEYKITKEEGAKEKEKRRNVQERAPQSVQERAPQSVQERTSQTENPRRKT